MRSNVTPHPHKDPDTAHITSHCNTNNIIYPSFFVVFLVLQYDAHYCTVLYHHKMADEREKLESRGNEDVAVSLMLNCAVSHTSHSSIYQALETNKKGFPVL